jgi:hypothetical protein
MVALIQALPKLLASRRADARPKTKKNGAPE